jgi:lipoprotein-releasing system permease protein
VARSGNRLNWFIARHYLRSGGGRGLLSFITWITLGGVTVGVLALNAALAIMNGMQDEIRSKILESTPHLYVLEYNSSLRLSDYADVLDAVLAMDAVTAAAPFALSNVGLSRDGYSQPAYIYGIDMDTTRVPVTEMERNIIDGVLDLESPESGLEPLLVGSVLADRMGLFPGDTMVIIAMENLTVNVMGLPQPAIRQFEVTGTFTTGMYEYDIGNVYTTLPAAQELLGMASTDASGIGAQLERPQDAREIAEEVKERLGFPYTVDSWVSRNSALFNALQLEKLAIGFVVSLIVLVAGFSIVGMLVMVVSERTKEIGILRTMGMTQDNIMRVFIMQGVWIGVVGTLAGTVLGVGMSWAIDRYELIRIPDGIYFVNHLAARINPTEISMIALTTMVVAFGATIYPALRAARMEPVDAIRHE